MNVNVETAANVHIDSAPAERSEEWFRNRDLWAVLIILAVMIIVSRFKWRYDNWLIEVDISQFFLPWFQELGTRLHHLDIPARNPYIFGGVPFAGDPESGWGYVVAMVLFTFFQATTAWKLMGFTLMTMAALSSYAFGRLLKCSILASMFGAFAFSLGPVAFTQTYRSTVAGLTTPFLPLAFLGIELALRSRRPWVQLAGMLTTAFAASQIIAGWLGQGAYISAILIGSWLMFRALVLPPVEHTPFRSRIIALVQCGALIGGLTLGLSAIGVLPRLAANVESNIPHGDYSTQQGGAYTNGYFTFAHTLHYVLSTSSSMRESAVGLIIPFVIIMGLLIPRRRGLLLYFTIAAAFVASMTIKLPVITSTLQMVPGYKSIIGHGPTRSLLYFAFPACMAAMISADRLRHMAPRPTAMVVAANAFVLITVAQFYALTDRSTRPDIWAWTSLIAAGTCVSALALPGLHRRFRNANDPYRLAETGLVILVVAFPFLIDWEHAASQPPAYKTKSIDFRNVNLFVKNLTNGNLSATDPGGAGGFLQHQQDAGQPFRYIAYAGQGAPGVRESSYIWRRDDPRMMYILSNGRHMPLGLETTQGYGPQRPRVFQVFNAALNGHEQDYHREDVYASGLSSPLLSMLNVRYIVVDRGTPINREDMAYLLSNFKVAYKNRHVMVFENPHYLPRAWVVYDVRNDDAGLKQLSDGSVDGRRVAFVEDTVPNLVKPTDNQKPKVFVTNWQPDQESFKVNQSGTGFMVFSEVWSKDWKATVDGKDVKIYRTDTALMGIEMPPGEHTVKLTYAPASLTQGVAVTGVTAVGSLAGVGYLWWDDRRKAISL